MMTITKVGFKKKRIEKYQKEAISEIKKLWRNYKMTFEQLPSPYIDDMGFFCYNQNRKDFKREETGKNIAEGIIAYMIYFFELESGGRDALLSKMQE